MDYKNIHNTFTFEINGQEQRIELYTSGANQADHEYIYKQIKQMLWKNEWNLQKK